MIIQKREPVKINIKINQVVFYCIALPIIIGSMLAFGFFAATVDSLLNHLKVDDGWIVIVLIVPLGGLALLCLMLPAFCIYPLQEKLKVEFF